MFFKVCFVLFLSLFALLSYFSVVHMELLKKYEINDSSCAHIDGPHGFEDQTSWNENVLISTQRDPSHKLLKNETLKKDGGMFVISNFSGKNEDVKITKLEISNWPEGLDFQPHGMDIEDTERRAYVINHAHLSERIEVFDVNVDDQDFPVSLTYLYSIKSDELNQKAYHALNSIAVVGPNKIYAPQWMAPEPFNTTEKPTFSLT